MAAASEQKAARACERRQEEILTSHASAFVGRRGAASVAAFALALTVGCSSTPAEKTQANMQTMRDEQTPEKLLERGRAFAVLGDPTRAEEYLASALDAGADPKDVMPTLLEVCIRNSRYRSAIQHAENHLRKHPSDVGTRLVLGNLYVALGEVRDGRAALERVITMRPDESQAHYALAVLARDHDNDPTGADRHFREYLRIRPAGEHAEEARASLLQRVP
jgi:tetratricopeptide (TPR) repeat protein